MQRLINFLVGLTIGMAIGSAIAALLAPQSGTETRERMGARVQQVLGEARRAAEATRAEAHIRLAEIKAGQVDS